jgi:glycosyltransferase involved in cell wall biosynthesis
MKIHILFKFIEGPWGGGNQFLKALTNEFIKMNVYEEDPYHADVILFNSYPSSNENLFKEILRLKKKATLVVHRIDGPISYVRGRDEQVDVIIYYFNHYFSDGTIFQSKWSKKKNYILGLKKNNFEIIINNAPDSEIFNRIGKTEFSRNRKSCLISTCWSANWNKGFEIYKWLDNNLDFKRYNMSFVGNSPIKFRNIHHIPPVTSKELAQILKKNDIFVTASKKDPCSNSLIEALHCGLPAIALKDGGHPEIIQNAGELFNKAEEIPTLLEKVVNHYDEYQKAINLPNIEQVATMYYDFMIKIYDKIQGGEYAPKISNRWAYNRLKIMIWNRKINTRLKVYVKKIIKKSVG